MARWMPSSDIAPQETGDIFSNISSPALANGIGNLFYDALGDFLRALSRQLQAIEIYHCMLHEAIVHIDAAWKICQGKDENHPKHARLVPGVALTLEEIAQHIAALPTPQQQLFFSHLSEKLNQDGVKDAQRGRTRLAQALFAAAESIGKMHNAPSILGVV